MHRLRGHGHARALAAPIPSSCIDGFAEYEPARGGRAAPWARQGTPRRSDCWCCPSRCGADARTDADTAVRERSTGTAVEGVGGTDQRPVGACRLFFGGGLGGRVHGAAPGWSVGSIRLPRALCRGPEAATRSARGRGSGGGFGKEQLGVLRKRRLEIDPRSRRDAHAYEGGERLDHAPSRGAPRSACDRVRPHRSDAIH